MNPHTPRPPALFLLAPSLPAPLHPRRALTPRRARAPPTRPCALSCTLHATSAPPPAPAPREHIPPGDDSLSAHIAAYVALRKSAAPSDDAHRALLTVAAAVVTARATRSPRSVQLIDDVLYRLRRAAVPLSPKFCNVLMSSLIRSGAPARAVALFEDIECPNVECFTTLASAHGALRSPDDAIAVLTAMRSRAVLPNVRTYNALIAACVRARQLTKARQLFSEMLVDDVRPNAVSWNILINWHVQQKRGPRRLRDALRAFADMKASGVAPTVATFTTMMKAYAKSGLLNKAEEVFAEMKNRLPAQLDTAVYNTLLSAYASRLEWRRSLELLHEMQHGHVALAPPDAAAPAARAQGVPRHSSSFSRRRPWLADARVPPPPAAAPTPPDANAPRCVPDAVTYSLVVKACADAGRPDRAREVFDRMLQQGIYPPPGPAVASLMSGYANAGLLSESFTILKNLKAWGVIPEARMLSSLMHACLTADQPALALSVYAKFKAAKFEPDVVTYTLLLKAYGMSAELDKAFNVLKAMHRHGDSMRPNIVTYNALIECTLSHNRPDLALKALDSLLSDDLTRTKLNRNTFEALVHTVRNDAGSRLSDLAPSDDALRTTAYTAPAGHVAGLDDAESHLQYLMDVLRRLREGGAMPNGTLYWALLTACDTCNEWHLGSSLVRERESGGFLVGRKDMKEIRILEDSFRARSVTDSLL